MNIPPVSSTTSIKPVEDNDKGRQDGDERPGAASVSSSTVATGSAASTNATYGVTGALAMMQRGG